MKTQNLRRTAAERETQVDEREALPPSLLAKSSLGKSAGMKKGERLLGTPWIVRRLLGTGGMGEVYEVEHALLGRPAALKVLHAGQKYAAGVAAAMADEGRFLASVRHPNLVDVLDLGILEADGRPYLILELLEGRDLRKELSRLRLFSVPAAIEIVAQALRGLSALHQAGIVHRDLKLENLFLCADGQIKILDLGAAEAGSSDIARRGLLLGTPRTMAPEHAAGRPVDARADIYAMGLVLYELICGWGPFDDVVSPEALQFAHAERTPAPPSRRSLQPISAAMDAFVLRALAKNPDDRFSNVEVMLTELLALMPRSRWSTRWSKEGTMGAECLLDTEPSAGILSSKTTTTKTRPKADRTWPATISALALAALALGVSLGRLLPPEALPSFEVSAAR